MHVWIADQDVLILLKEVKEKHHKRLEEATITSCFNDSKPFIKSRFNFGKVSKFSPLTKLLQEHDFAVIIPVDSWYNVLSGSQREALLDLHLTRCQPEYIPIINEENGKPVKDKWGRLEYTDQIKLDEEGNPIWRLLPLDLYIFSENVKRYGIWCDEILEFKNAIKEQENKKSFIPNADVVFSPSIPVKISGYKVAEVVPISSDDE